MRNSAPATLSHPLRAVLLTRALAPMCVCSRFPCTCRCAQGEAFAANARISGYASLRTGVTDAKYCDADNWADYIDWAICGSSTLEVSITGLANIARPTEDEDDTEWGFTLDMYHSGGWKPFARSLPGLSTPPFHGKFTIDHEGLSITATIQLLEPVVLISGLLQVSGQEGTSSGPMVSVSLSMPVEWTGDIPPVDKSPPMDCDINRHGGLDPTSPPSQQSGSIQEQQCNTVHASTGFVRIPGAWKGGESFRGHQCCASPDEAFAARYDEALYEETSTRFGPEVFWCPETRTSADSEERGDDEGPSYLTGIRYNPAEGGDTIPRGFIEKIQCSRFNGRMDSCKWYDLGSWEERSEGFYPDVRIGALGSGARDGEPGYLRSFLPNGEESYEDVYTKTYTSLDEAQAACLADDRCNGVTRSAKETAAEGTRGCFGKTTECDCCRALEGRAEYTERAALMGVSNECQVIEPQLDVNGLGEVTGQTTCAPLLCSYNNPQGEKDLCGYISEVKKSELGDEGEDFCAEVLADCEDAPTYTLRYGSAETSTELVESVYDEASWVKLRYRYSRRCPDEKIMTGVKVNPLSASYDGELMAIRCCTAVKIDTPQSEASARRNLLETGDVSVDSWKIAGAVCLKLSVEEQAEGTPCFPVDLKGGDEAGGDEAADAAFLLEGYYTEGDLRPFAALGSFFGLFMPDRVAEWIKNMFIIHANPDRPLYLKLEVETDDETDEGLDITATGFFSATINMGDGWFSDIGVFKACSEIGATGYGKIFVPKCVSPPSPLRALSAKPGPLC